MEKVLIIGEIKKVNLNLIKKIWWWYLTFFCVTSLDWRTLFEFNLIAKCFYLDDVEEKMVGNFSNN